MNLLMTFLLQLPFHKQFMPVKFRNIFVIISTMTAALSAAKSPVQVVQLCQNYKALFVIIKIDPFS
jgi:hypothetical protein